MATRKNSCPTCKGTGFYHAQDHTFDGLPLSSYTEDYCACEEGQFREWQDAIIELLDEEAWLIQHGSVSDIYDLNHQVAA